MISRRAHGSEPQAGLAFLIVALALHASLARAADESTSETPRDSAALFLAEVGPLLTEAERAAYLALDKPYQRTAFEEQFWKVRDPFPETAINELAVRWRERAPLAREKWETLDDARALASVLAGEPAAVVRVACGELLRPGEIWRFGGSGRVGGSVVVFVAEGLSPKARHRAWSPREGIHSLAVAAGAGTMGERDLLERIAMTCPRGSEIASLLSVAVDWEALVAHQHLLPRSNDEWLRGFSAHSTDLPAGAAPLPAELDLRFPGRRGMRTLVEGAIRLAAPPAADAAFTLDGEIVREEELFDRFRYRFQAGAGQPASFFFERPLRPGRYRLLVRMREGDSDRYFRVDRELVVPFEPDAPLAVLAGAAPQADPSAGQPAVLASTSPAGGESPPLPAASPGGGEALPADEPALDLHVSTAKLVTGKLRVDAQVRGDAIAKVEFALDGKPVLTKKRPPFGVELDLGRMPRLHAVTAIGYDAAGVEVARDEELLNGGPHRFALRIVEPKSIPPGAERVTATAELDLPEGERLDRVEFFVNSVLHATLFQPPYVQSLPIPAGADPAWIRAVGHLVGGGAAEDVRLVGSAEYASAVEVDFVELHASIVDRRGRIVDDVRAEEVVLEEAGERQTIQRFELLRDLPIHAGLLLDTSASMAEELEEAERAALRFFSEVLTDRDRAAVVTFADEPRLAVRFTRSVEALAGGLADLEAEGQSRIWDALAFTLHYFSGIKGKRALVLLSDGMDSGSKYAIADVLDYARRTGVAIYTIGMNVPRYPPDANMYLTQLAHETGGRTYQIQRAVELGPIYKTIERELRAQYLVAYQSTNATGDGFRPIEIQVDRPGVDVVTASGYYP